MPWSQIASISCLCVARYLDIELQLFNEQALTEIRELLDTNPVGPCSLLIAKLGLRLNPAGCVVARGSCAAGACVAPIAPRCTRSAPMLPRALLPHCKRDCVWVCDTDFLPRQDQDHQGVHAAGAQTVAGAGASCSPRSALQLRAGCAVAACLRAPPLHSATVASCFAIVPRRLLPFSIVQARTAHSVAQHSSAVGCLLWAVPSQVFESDLIDRVLAYHSVALKRCDKLSDPPLLCVAFTLLLEVLLSSPVLPGFV